MPVPGSPGSEIKLQTILEGTISHQYTVDSPQTKNGKRQKYVYDPQDVEQFYFHQSSRHPFALKKEAGSKQELTVSIGPAGTTQTTQTTNVTSQAPWICSKNHLKSGVLS